VTVDIALADPGGWIDHGVTPPQRLPAAPEDQVRYLAAALGHPVYERWTWARLLQAYSALADARRAKPAVCQILLGASEAVEFWQRGRVRVSAGVAAPPIDVILAQVRLVHARRFRRTSTELPVGAPGVSTSLLTPTITSEVLLDPSTWFPQPVDRWLQRRGRFANPDRETNALGAADDLAAVATFLRERASRSRHTWRAYVAELSRLIAWCQQGARGPLSELSRQDLLVFRDDQRRASPAVDEVATSAMPARSASAQARTMAVVASLYRFWHRAGYLSVNPAAELGAARRARQGFSARRLVSATLLERCDDAVRSAVLQRPPVAAIDDSEAVRAWRRLTIWSLYRVTGARLSELAWREDSATPKVAVDEAGHWTLRVLGKGHRERSIPLPDWCAAVLQGYREARGLPPRPTPFEHVALIHGEKRAALGTAGLYDEVKAVLSDVASRIEAEDATAAAVLRSVSPHWLRHAFARTLVVEHAVPLPAVQMLMGHASVQTTAEYARADVSKLREFVERGFARGATS